MEIIGIDFDGTCVTHEFPEVGKDIGAVSVLKRIVEKGHKLILFTMRSDRKDVKTTSDQIHPRGGDYLTRAIRWFKENDIKLYGVNENPDQRSWTDSPKPYCTIYIDDSGLGCPLKFDPKFSKRPYVNWARVEQMLEEMEVI